MGLGDLLKRLFGGGEEVPAGRLGVEELARRLGMTLEELRAVPVSYREFQIPKRAGGVRRIQSPNEQLKALQRRILCRLLARLKSSAYANGFERGRSIVTNALPHTGRAVVLKMDLKDFFTSTRDERVRRYFRRIGWDGAAADLLTRLCTREGGLPQGAPTSPRLSNLVNYGLDAALASIARRFDARYTRYADDLTFSFAVDDPRRVREVVSAVKAIVAREGYRLHQDRKLQVRRRHHRQQVTGLVVNESVNLPRRTRRMLRAVEHHLANGKEATLTQAQLEGRHALKTMIVRQSQPS